MNFWLIIFWTFLSTSLSYLKVKYNYWDLRGIKQLKPHFIWGNLAKLKSLDHRYFMQEIYEAFHKQAKVAGAYIFTKPIAVILDLEVVKTLLIKDFDKFSTRLVYHNDKDILSRSLFNLEGAEWKPLRNTFSPTFSLEKMKFIFPTIKRIAENCLQAYEKCLEEAEDLNVTELNTRYVTDGTGEVLLGLECNSLEDPNVEFRQVCRKMFRRSNFNIRWHIFKHTYVNIMKYFGHKNISHCIETFFRDTVCTNIKAREQQAIVRHDFVDILLEMKTTTDMNLSYEDLASQLLIFFVASFETSSATMSNALFELARHTQIQEKLRKEILKVLASRDNELSYEALMEMKYLDQVINETLRLYAPLSYLQRIASEDYQIPHTDIILDKGTEVFIPVRAIHYDAEIFKNPHEFQPERFSTHEVAQRHPQAFLGFGDGPRNCIGMLYGRIQVKLCLVMLLRHFRFTHSQKTCQEIEFSNHQFGTVPAADIYLKVEKLEGKC
uniref:Cytochrome P450 n=1 Tax=Stomoxys calcitrans TaxID=35570 RepID=A0A1I8NRZ3_STOCA